VVVRTLAAIVSVVVVGCSGDPAATDAGPAGVDARPSCDFEPLIDDFVGDVITPAP
jgi:hypothetical protein